MKKYPNTASTICNFAHELSEWLTLTKLHEQL